MSSYVHLYVYIDNDSLRSFSIIVNSSITVRVSLESKIFNNDIECNFKSKYS